jgi:hypothetical protein
MHAVLRALPLVALGLVSIAVPRAQTPELPAIFAPRAAVENSPSFVRSAPRAGMAPVSERVRSLISAATVRALEDVVVFEAPSSTREVVVDEKTGAMVMAPVVVRGQTLQERHVRPPTPRLYHFTPVGGDKFRRIAGGASAVLYHTFIGNKEFQVDLNVFNLAGKGIDHNIDFSRAEIAFSLKW